MFGAQFTVESNSQNKWIIYKLAGKFMWGGETNNGEENKKDLPPFDRT